MKRVDLSPIRCKLVNQQGDTVTRKDGSVMTFILIDEASLLEKIAWWENQAWSDSRRNVVAELKEILGDAP